VEPDPHPKWEAPDGLDGAGYLKALKAYERARNSSPASLWSVALRHGFTLDAPVRWRDNVALVDAPDGRTLAVCTRGAIDPTLAEHLAKMSDLTVALHDAALDVAGRIRLARTATVQVI
jgi:hypothetical protein